MNRKLRRIDEPQGSCPSRPINQKPPLGKGGPFVQPWEKQFCYSHGRMAWSKIIETKRCMHLYDKVVNWNDSACEEAFICAKSRFWAMINGHSCDISLPDPDTYIDKVDWNCNTDPVLMSDLEKARGRRIESCPPSSVDQIIECDWWGGMDLPIPSDGWGGMDLPVPCDGSDGVGLPVPCDGSDGVGLPIPCDGSNGVGLPVPCEKWGGSELLMRRGRCDRSPCAFGDASNHILSR